MWETTINLDNNTINADLNAVRSFELTGLSVYKTYTKAVNTGSLADPYYQIKFYTSGASAPTGNRTLEYTKQPTDQTRGDFEAGRHLLKEHKLSTLILLFPKSTWFLTVNLSLPKLVS